MPRRTQPPYLTCLDADARTTGLEPHRARSADRPGQHGLQRGLAVHNSRRNHDTAYFLQRKGPYTATIGRKNRAVVGSTYDPAQALNVVKMMAGTEDMFPALAGLVKAVFEAAGVDPKLRQMIILRAAKVLKSPYEWQANVPMSLNNGLS